MITARDVATELGISISTVGRAMADDPRISDETKARVRRSAERLGYAGNTAARIMRGGSSKLIGLMIPDVANDFYASIAQAMSDCLDRQGYRLVLSLTRDDRDVESRQIKELVGARATGIIIVPTSNPRRESRAMIASVPHVQFLRHLPIFGSSWFGIDDETGIRTATEHLIRLGHRRIAYVGGGRTLSTGSARVAGYRSALLAAGLTPPPELECLGPPVKAFGETSLHTLLALAEPPTALLTGSVHITEGVMAAADDLQLDVPARLAIVGFGGSPWFATWRGGLTAVVPPIHELATSCALWFLDQLSTKRTGETTAHTATSASTFVVRCSTAPPTASAARRAAPGRLAASPIADRRS